MSTNLSGYDIYLIYCSNWNILEQFFEQSSTKLRMSRRSEEEELIASFPSRSNFECIKN